jgi:hypothetical protein
MPLHTWCSGQKFIVKNKTPVVPQPPYVPAVCPLGFFLFPKLKMSIKRTLILNLERKYRKK